MLAFLFLSLLSGVLELGVLYLSVLHCDDAWMIFLLPMMYQLGNLLSAIPVWSARHTVAVAGIGAMLIPCTMFYGSAVLFAVQVAAASMCIQIARAEQKAICAAWLKRVFRIGGFIVSPVVTVCPHFVLVFCFLIPIVVLLRKDLVKLKIRPVEPNFVPVMVFHQMHYFVYTYILPAWVFLQSKSLIVSALVFAITWVVYLLPQTIADHVKKVDLRAMFFLCHSFLALVMVVMCVGSICDSRTVIMLAWVLTGLGGGSVFCIKHLTCKLETVDMTFSENFGHMAGVVVALILARLFSENVVFVLTAASVTFVCSTLVSGALLVRKEGN